MDERMVEQLMNEEKVLLDFSVPKLNSRKTFTVKGTENDFLFDCQLGETGRFVLLTKPLGEMKQTHQTRYKNNFLIRVDLNAPPHFCENGELLKNHIHVYLGDDENGKGKIKVYPLEQYDKILFKNLNGYNVMFDFFKLCNIKLPREVSIQEGI